MKSWLVVVFLLSLCSCGGSDRQYDDYQIRSISDLTLSAQNHPHGFGKNQCFVCHNISNIHQVDRLRAPNFSLAQPLVLQSGLASCSGCHGNNGVP